MLLYHLPLLKTMDILRKNKIKIPSMQWTWNENLLIDLCCDVIKINKQFKNFKVVFWQPILDQCFRAKTIIFWLFTGEGVGIFNDRFLYVLYGKKFHLLLKLKVVISNILENGPWASPILRLSKVRSIQSILHAHFLKP